MVKRKVFLVEDEKVMREGIRRKINWEEEGLEYVGDAGDGELAYPMILQNKPDILITDIKMPFMDGLELSRLVKKELPDIKIIILSGYDEFEYAKEAINIGIAEYLLKPVTSVQLLESLRKIRTVIEEESMPKQADSTQSEMWAKNQQRQKFVQKLVSGKTSAAELLSESMTLHIDLAAECYNILMLQFFGEEEPDLTNRIYTRIQENVQQLLIPVWVMISQNELYCLLCGENAQQIADQVEQIQIFLDSMPFVEYFGALGEAVQRLSEVRHCYEVANLGFSQRYLKEHQQILQHQESKEELSVESEQLDLESLTGSQISWKELEQFLYTGAKSSVAEFVEQNIERIGKKNLNSIIFRQYFLLDVYMIALSVIEKVGATGREFAERCDAVQKMEDALRKVDNTQTYVQMLLETAIDLREAHAGRKYDALIHKAQHYIEENYGEPEISLNVVAQEVNISPNHFSAIFSQETGKTFVEYLTAVRMEKARQLLRTSSMRTTDIAFAVGYKDPHYFSTLFKRMQGCTPKEYRKQES